ncbi:YkgJ family cysteine cluster protein [Teredinibacter sp. KSP-S5-2]|uniref:YkgJ family cysteine cluster protein n=1 Tax=Teredinibacter sp. KSP-S5-2 TaxID=3034506 RepID=UPI003977AC5C
MECRPNCGACCIVPSINNPIPGMPNGKPAGTVCVNLNLETMNCRIWGQSQYPKVCQQFRPEKFFCGDTREEAIELLTWYEEQTRN